jgi:hypothetical protein
MNLNEKIVYNILLKLKEIDDNETFKKNNPSITAREYLYAKVHENIKLKRLISILNGKAKRITTYELIYISEALNIKVSDLVK